ncbi:hypothetical protein [Zhouia spongiae]|nr:hypothetical protein [Zhouia spongiae]
MASSYAAKQQITGKTMIGYTVCQEDTGRKQGVSIEGNGVSTDF